MASKRKWAWVAGVAAIVAIGFWGLYSSGAVQRAATSSAASGLTGNAGKPAPSFRLTDLQNRPVALADFKGQKVYVKYWASWCPICLAGLDELNQLSGEPHDYKVLSIVSPAFNGEQSRDDFVNWFSKRGYGNVEVLLDDGGTWAKEFGVKGYPTSYYIGSDGILVKGAPGHQSNEAIEQAFQTIH
ncbi:TlpA family protein disulfide reductase [Paenibacillus hodogayensis]|uniref:TlpA family protein disulfide reductase n=1 Tax=Paenibacillus hodogayensis TaxID=279208 RepID=A0ABV5VQ58_9BACL